jgi:hypothetical protein
MSRCLALIAAGLAVAGCANTGPSRGASVHRNEQVFRQLPRFPGSRLEAEISTPARTEEDGPIVGYTTRFELRLPALTTGERVAAFYASRLRPNWRLVERLGGPVLNFRRGPALVSINLESWKAHLMEIGITTGD